MTALIDTHVLLWWLKKPALLSPAAHHHFAAWEAGLGKAMLSGVSLWEIEYKQLQGKLELQAPAGNWISILSQISWIQWVDTTAEIWSRAANLPWNHRDPADRIIAATALVHQVPLITKDRKFHKTDSPVKAIW